MRTLPALSSFDPKEFGREQFSSHKPYFPRQIKSFYKATLSQAVLTDVDSNASWLAGSLAGVCSSHVTSATCPTSARWVARGSFTATYKFDNLVLPLAENRVITILDWELCTIGILYMHAAPHQQQHQQLRHHRRHHRRYAFL
jgi:hypothetical protein